MAHLKQSLKSASTSTAEAFTSVRIFWNWSGSYVGYRASDGLFRRMVIRSDTSRKETRSMDVTEDTWERFGGATV
jgi:hypothetical protein